MPDFDPKLLRTLIDSLTIGLLYALIAVGYTMVYGIIKLINFAHGEVFMVGTFLGLVVINGYGSALAVPLTLACYGIALLAMMFGPWRAGWQRAEGALLLALCAALAAIAGSGAPGASWLVPSVTLGAAVLAALLALRAWEARREQAALVAGAGALALGAQLAAPAVPALGWLAAVPLAMAGCMTLGWMIDLLAYRPLRFSTRLAALITAIGISLSLQTIVQLITPNWHGFDDQRMPSLLGAVFASYQAPGAPAVHLQGKDLAIWGTALALMIALDLIVNHSRIGKAMRACSHDKQTAALMGIDVDRVIVVTFMLGSAMAAVAGILMGVRVGGNISFRFGYYPGLIAFAAAVLGGIGSIRGAFLGGLVLGATQVCTKTYVSGDYEFSFAFGVMILTILVRPQGLLGRPEAKRA
jgi:branched-chain amino acid transport system permease protein